MLLPKKVGTFTLMRTLGADGLTESYVGILDDPAGKQMVARRVLPHMSRDAQRLSELQVRVGDLQACRHPTLVPLLDFVDVDGEHYILEDWIDTVSLRALIDHHIARGTTLRHNVYLNLATQVCNGLEALHGRPGAESGAANVLHMGLTPDAVHVTRDGQVVIGAYGLVRSPTALPHTGTNSIGTSMEYLAPEQTHQDQALSPASDIFALGALLYELLTLRPMFRAESPLQTIHRIRRAEVTTQLLEVKELLPGLDRVLYRALSLNPRHRYQRAFVLREDLRGLMAGYTFSDIEAVTRDELTPVFHGRSDRESDEVIPRVGPDGPRETTASLLGGVDPAMVAGAVDLDTQDTESHSALFARELSEEMLRGPDTTGESELLEVDDDTLPPKESTQWVHKSGDPDTVDSMRQGAQEDTAVRRAVAPMDAPLPGPAVTEERPLGDGLVTQESPLPDVLMDDDLVVPPDPPSADQHDADPHDAPPVPLGNQAPVEPARSRVAPTLLPESYDDEADVELLPDAGEQTAESAPPEFLREALDADGGDLAELGAAAESAPLPRPEVVRGAATDRLPAPRVEPTFNPRDLDRPEPQGGPNWVLLGGGAVAVVLAVVTISCLGIGGLTWLNSATGVVVADARTDEAATMNVAPPEAPRDAERIEANVVDDPEPPEREPDRVPEPPTRRVNPVPGPSPVRPSSAPAPAPAPPAPTFTPDPAPARPEPRSDPLEDLVADLDPLPPPPPEETFQAVADAEVPSASSAPLGPLDGDALQAASQAAFRGGLDADTAMRLSEIGGDDPDFTRARTLLFLDAKARGATKERDAHLAALMAIPENRYNPALLVEEASVAMGRDDWPKALDRAELAERHWARLPSELIFSRKAMMFEIQALAHTGVFYDSDGDDLDALNQAIRGWEKYRQHVSTKSRADLQTRADEHLGRLYEIQRRME